MKTKHTPGPWKYQDSKIISTTAFLDLCDDEKIPVEVLNLYGAMGGFDVNADAKLIAAAPELLAECMRAQDEIASALRDGVTHFNEDMLRRWYKGVSEAITKATNP